MFNKNNAIKEEFEYLKAEYPDDKRYESSSFEPGIYRIPKNRPVRIYCDGVFDMFHYGHARLFYQVKKMFPNVYLIVGVHNDEETLKYKGTVAMNENERYESVSHCKYVDEVIENAPWVHKDLEFIRKYDIDYVAHDGDPYPCGQLDDLYNIFKKNGIFIPTKRATHVSTTKIITNIVKDYDKFVKRQISRGVSYKELNISYIRRKQMRLESIFNFRQIERWNGDFFRPWTYFYFYPIGYCYRGSMNILSTIFFYLKGNKYS